MTPNPARPLSLAWACLLALAASTALAQEQVYNEDWLAPGEVPPSIRASAEKAAANVRFEATYRGPDLGYRFVGTGPDKKVVSVKLAEDGRPISTRTWTPSTLAKLPKPALAAIQVETLDNPQIAGFRASKVTSVELYRVDKGTTETYFELLGARGDQTPARAEVTPLGNIRRAEIILRRPVDRDTSQAIPPASIPPVVRQQILEAAPGSTFTKGIYEVGPSGLISVVAVGLDKLGRSVEIRASLPAEREAEPRRLVQSISTRISLDEVPPEARAKLRDGLASDDKLKGFQADETRQVATPWTTSDSGHYLVFGKNAKGRRVKVKFGRDSSVEAWEDRSTPEITPGTDRKFAVLAALYGADDRWIDVTREVRAKVEAGRLDWEPGSLPDPAEGVHKVLAVAYSADGLVGLDLARDDRPLNLPRQGLGRSDRFEVPPKGFAVLSALYGADERWGYLTEELRAQAAGGTLEVANPSADRHDPGQAPQRALLVAYALDGEVGLRAWRGDRPLALPEGRPISGAPSELWKVELPAAPSTASVGFSGDGRLVFVGGEDGVVRYLDAADGKELGRLEDSGEGKVEALAVSPTGAILVARPGRPVHLWPSKESKRPIPLGDYKEGISALAIAPQGDRAATGSWDRSARTWDLKTGRMIRQFLGHKAVVVGVAFTPDGRQIATTSWDGTARLWETSTGSQKFEYEGDNGQLGKVQIPGNGQLALFTSDRGSLITWDLATGKLRNRVVAPTSAGWALALSPDGSRMADAEENAAVLRDVATLKVVARLERHVGKVNLLAFSPNGRQLLTGATDRSVRLWKLPEPSR